MDSSLPFAFCVNTYDDAAPWGRVGAAPRHPSAHHRTVWVGLDVAPSVLAQVWTRSREKELGGDGRRRLEKEMGERKALEAGGYGVGEKKEMDRELEIVCQPLDLRKSNGGNA